MAYEICSLRAFSYGRTWMASSWTELHPSQWNEESSLSSLLQLVLLSKYCWARWTQASDRDSNNLTCFGSSHVKTDTSKCCTTQSSKCPLPAPPSTSLAHGNWVMRSCTKAKPSGGKNISQTGNASWSFTGAHRYDTANMIPVCQQSYLLWRERIM